MGPSEDRELVPLQSDFDVVWRGYRRSQVQFYIQQTETELRLAHEDRDSALSQVEDLSQQLSQARAEIESLREQLDAMAQSPISEDALNTRLRRMVRLAQDEAQEIVSSARAAADHEWSRSEQAAAELRERYQRLVSDADEWRQQWEEQRREALDQTNAEIERLSTEAEQRRRQLDNAAEQRRSQVEHDFEVAMAERREETNRELAERDEQSRNEAQRRVREATEDADRRVREATERSERLVADATAEAQRLVSEANTDSERRVREATEEVNRRLQDANEKTASLCALRRELAQSVQAANELLGQAEPLLEASVNGVDTDSAQAVVADLVPQGWLPSEPQVAVPQQRGDPDPTASEDGAEPECSAEAAEAADSGTARSSPS